MVFKMNIMTTKYFSTILLTLLLALPAGAQKLTLGTTTTKDGGSYNGEMQAGKPHGKGKTTYKNGNVYEVTESTPSMMERNTRVSGSRTNSMVMVFITSPTTTVMTVCGSVTTSMVMV